MKLSGVDAAYWCETPDRNPLRWVMPHAEERLLDALARVHAAGTSSLGEGTRLVGSFRAHGLTVPVWDLPSEALTLLRYGRTIDNTRFKRAGFEYRYTSAGTVEAFAQGLRLAGSVGEKHPSYKYQREVEDFFRHSPAVVRQD